MIYDLQDKLLDSIYWLKQGLAVVVGIVFGFIPITGLAGAIT